MNDLPNILIVDDTEENLLYLEAVLKGDNFILLKAFSGQEALKISEGIELALAIIDVRMPEMSGYELAVRLNEKRSGEKVPVIFLTANFFDEIEIFKGYDSGAVDYIFKPIDKRILLGKINIFLDLFNQKKIVIRDSVQLKESAEELIKVNAIIRKSKEKYRSYIHNAPDGVFVTDESGKYIEVNQALSKSSGYSMDDLLKMSFSDILSVESSEKSKILFSKVAFCGASRADLTFVHKKGFSKWWTIELVKLSETRFLGFAKDITQRVKLEEELMTHRVELEMKNEELTFTKEKAEVASRKYTKLFDFAPSGFFTLSEDKVIQDYNHSGALMLGINNKRKRLIDNDFNFYISENSKPVFEAFIHKVFKTKTKEICEVMMVTDDNHPRVVHIEGIIAEDGDNCLINVVDITQRKQAEETLRESEEKFRSVTQSANDAIITTNREGLIMGWNRGAEKIFGYSENEIRGKNLTKIIPDQPSEEFNIYRLLVDNDYFNQGESIEKSGLHKQGYEFPIELSLADWESVSGKYFTAVIRDITRRKQIEKVLIESESNLSAAQRIAQMGSWEWDMVSKSAKWSKEIFRIFDINPDSFDGNPESLIKRIHPDDVKLFKNSLKNDFSKADLSSFQYRVIHNDGSVHNILAQGSIEFSDAGDPLRKIRIVQDITERKRIEDELKASLEQLHQLTKYIEKVREDERKSISRDLHDDLGQALTAVIMELGIVRRDTSEQRIIERINKVLALVSETIKTIQRLTYQLRPDIIDDLGIDAAIEWYTKEFSQRNQLDIILDLDPEIVIPSDSSLTVFRIMQESLTNIARHAKATEIQIRLSRTSDSIHFEISDNGIGINDEELNAKKSFGIIGMKERAASLGGTCDIYRKNNQGTEIKLIFPLNYCAYENSNL
jgi:two-component system sensor histidine kinase UhpB